MSDGPDPARVTLADLAGLRRANETAGLDDRSLPVDPVALFDRWLSDAVAAGLPEATAMVVSTVGDGDAPSSRMVLCKSADERGFVFFTNYHSRKAREIAARGEVSLLFP